MSYKQFIILFGYFFAVMPLAHSVAEKGVLRPSQKQALVPHADKTKKQKSDGPEKGFAKQNASEIRLDNLPTEVLCTIFYQACLLTRESERTISGSKIHASGKALETLANIALVSKRFKEIIHHLKVWHLASGDSLFGKLNTLENAHGLRLTKKGLKEIPHYVGALKELRRLDISDNPLGAMYGQRKLLFNQAGHDSLARLKNCHSLTYLDLSSCHLMELPQALGACVGLTTLNISNNKLSYLLSKGKKPQDSKRSNGLAALGTLKNLTTLYLSNNLLQTLPKQMACLQHLTQLDVSGNNFALLPEVIGNLKQLKILDVSGNAFDKWSNEDTIHSLQDLKELPLICLIMDAEKKEEAGLGHIPDTLPE